MLDISITRTGNPSAKPGADKALRFGRIFTDHMFLLDYTQGEGWHGARIVPFGNLSLSPAAMVFHYAQEMFEGLKAYRAPDGRTLLFRPDMNARRMRTTCARLCIPEVPEEDFLQAVNTLVHLEKDWVPSQEGSSLYIRPYVIATEGVLGVAPSKTYLFVIILSPSGSYYEGGLTPVGIWIEDDYVRAAPGGMGYLKAGGNYACSLVGQVKAHGAGYAQALWLDAVHRRFIEEVGAMNIFFKIAGRVVTPDLSCGSILAGVTRDSVLTLCRDWGIQTEERPIAIDELLECWGRGEVEEVFGTGTAAVISPVGRLCYKDTVHTVGDGGIGPLSRRLYDELTGIQYGRLADRHGWTREVQGTVNLGVPI